MSYTVIYLYLLPYQPLIAQGTYIDENALNPGHATSHLTAQHVHDMQAWQRRWMTGQVTIEQEMRTMGLATYHTCYPDIHPYLGTRLSTSTCIAHGIRHATHADGKESLVLVVEYDTRRDAVQQHETVPSGLSMVMGVMQYLACE